MTKIKDLVAFFEQIAPQALQESYDNAGLIVGDAEQEIRGVLVCLDSTPQVIAEAIAFGCNVVVAHHPIVFRGLKRFNGANYIEQAVMMAIKHDIAIFAIHTNLDNVLQNGVNGKIADKLQLQDCCILAPKLSEEIGAGILGHLAQAMKTTDFLAYLKQKMEISVIKHTAIVKDQVQQIAICGGSGSFLLPNAIQANADVFITADFKYHEYFDANNQLMIADIGHYESERFTIELLYDLISNNFCNFALQYTKVNTNPVNYY